MVRVKELSEGSKVFRVTNGEIKECTVFIEEGKGKKPLKYYLIHTNKKGKKIKSKCSPNKKVALTIEDANILLKEYVKKQKQKEKRIRKEIENKEIENKAIEKEEIWYENHLEELIKAYKEGLEKYDINVYIINFIRDNFNCYNKYLLNCIGYERGRTYYETELIENYDVNKIYNEDNLKDGFLAQVYTGCNEFYNYLTFYDEFYRDLDEELYDLVIETSNRFIESDNIYYWLGEDTYDIRTDFINEFLYKVNWEDFKKYVI